MKKIFLLFLFSSCVVFQGSAAIYMKFPGVDGEVTLKGHEKEIEIQSAQFGVGRPATISGTGTTVSNPSFSEITLTKMMDIASTALMTQATAGKAPTTPVVITFTAQGNGGTPYTYCTFTLDGALVTGYSMSSGGDRPSESLSLFYTKIKVEYTPEGAAAATPFTWNLITLKP